MSFAGLESFLTDNIEGFFNKHLIGDIEPAELCRELAREVGKRATAEKNDGHAHSMGSFAPNEYDIFLAPADYERLCSQRVITMLTSVVRREIIKRDCFVEGVLRVNLKKNSADKGGFRMVSRFCAEEQPAAPVSDEDATIVLPERLSFKNPLNLPAEEKFVALRVVDGADMGAYLEFGTKKIFIGRRDLNDFILTDDSVSRIHASIEYKNGRNFLRDEKSANGTKIGGERIFAPVCLNDGDEISFGDTVVRYEVM